MNFLADFCCELFGGFIVSRIEAIVNGVSSVPIADF